MLSSLTRIRRRCTKYDRNVRTLENTQSVCLRMASLCISFLQRPRLEPELELLYTLTPELPDDISCDDGVSDCSMARDTGSASGGVLGPLCSEADTSRTAAFASSATGPALFAMSLAACCTAPTVARPAPSSFGFGV
jgi:hypothetical protein